MKIPNLAIHLTTERGKFEPNNETHTKPMFATAVIDSLFGEEVKEIEEDMY
jgi:aspartyl aminopeptidase